MKIKYKQATKKSKAMTNLKNKFVVGIVNDKFGD